MFKILLKYLSRFVVVWLSKEGQLPHRLVCDAGNSCITTAGGFLPNSQEKWPSFCFQQTERSFKSEIIPRFLFVLNESEVWVARRGGDLVSSSNMSIKTTFIQSGNIWHLLLSREHDSRRSVLRSDRNGNVNVSELGLANGWVLCSFSTAI